MEIKRILITGKEGALASRLCETLAAGEVFAFSKSELDITDRRQLFDKLDELSPDIIIHAAAMTNVEACESEVDACYRTNLVGTQNLVDAAMSHNPLFIYLSSTGIYGTAKNGPYTELDTPNPPTVHHKSKFAAEESIRAHLPRHLIIRTGWLFGANISQPKNFVYNRYKEALNTPVLQSDTTQFGNPTYIGDLVDQLLHLIQHDLHGTYNAVNSGIASRFEYVQKIIEYFGLANEVKPAGAFQRVAPVSPNESAVNYKLNLMGLNIMPHWEESLQCYIEALKKAIRG